MAQTRSAIPAEGRHCQALPPLPFPLSVISLFFRCFHTHRNPSLACHILSSPFLPFALSFVYLSLSLSLLFHPPSLPLDSPFLRFRHDDSPFRYFQLLADRLKISTPRHFRVSVFRTPSLGSLFRFRLYFGSDSPSEWEQEKKFEKWVD